MQAIVRALTAVLTFSALDTETPDRRRSLGLAD